MVDIKRDHGEPEGSSAWQSADFRPNHSLSISLSYQISQLWLCPQRGRFQQSTSHPLASPYYQTRRLLTTRLIRRPDYQGHLRSVFIHSRTASSITCKTLVRLVKNIFFSLYKSWQHKVYAHVEVGFPQISPKYSAIWGACSKKKIYALLPILLRSIYTCNTGM